LSGRFHNNGVIIDQKAAKRRWKITETQLHLAGQGIRVLYRFVVGKTKNHLLGYWIMGKRGYK
jgi:transposase-like protein